MKVRDVIKLIEQDGWRLVAQRGSHRQYKHLTKKGRVTVPGHPSEDMNPNTQKSVMIQAGLQPEKRP
jgi:predicted RNA binding protein YcfA (HicA-like mRNA interferase family)